MVAAFVAAVSLAALRTAALLVAAGSFANRRAIAGFVAALFALFGAAAAAPAQASAAAPPADFFGIGDWQWPSSEESNRLGDQGVRTVRLGLSWDAVEHVRGTRDWAPTDKLMWDASAGGYDLTWAINGCAAWACGITRTAPQSDEQRAAFQSFVAEAVDRYGAGGSFWRHDPWTRKVGVSWQVWNEVNVGQDWPNPTTGGYAQMLRETSATIKAVDPAARVITSGLAEMPVDAAGAPLSTFLEGLEREPGFQNSADVVAVHGYAEDPAGLARILDTTRRVMSAAGDTRPIWVTELGWAAGGPAHPFNVGPDLQAAYLRDAFAMMYGCRDRWNLGRAYWFSLQDVTASQLGEGDFWGLHTGLRGADGAEKPAAAAFREYVGGRELPDGRGASCSLPGGASVEAAIRAAQPPIVKIESTPALVGHDSPGLVEFSSTVGALGRTECSVGGGPWTVCSSPWAVPKVEGVGSLAVRGIDRTGTRSVASATTSWLVDLTPPRTVFRKKPPKKVKASSVLVQFGVTGGTRSATGQPEPVTFQCSLNGAKWAPCPAQYRARSKRAGKQKLRVRAVDAAGNVDYVGATAKYTTTKKPGKGKKAKSTKSKKKAPAKKTALA